MYSHFSIVEFDECVQGLNTTLCSGYRRLYAFWFEPTCVPKINQIETQTGSLNDTRTYLTPATNLDTHTTITTDSSNPSLYSTSEKYPQKEGQASSSPITGKLERSGCCQSTVTSDFTLKWLLPVDCHQRFYVKMVAASRLSPAILR